MSIKIKLLLSFLLLGLLPAGIISVLSLYISAQGLEKQTYNQLSSISHIKSKQLYDYFKGTKTDLNLLTKNWESLSKHNPDLSISELTTVNHTWFDGFITDKGYYDLFVISPAGFIDYTFAKEADYLTSLKTGPYQTSGLATLFEKIMITRSFEVVDFSKYAPSNEEPAAFIGQPIIIDDEVVGVIALQLSINAINNIMQTREGMGQTGESYLVGDDLLMRSDSYLDPEGHSVVASFAGNVKNNGVDTAAVQKALQGYTDTEIIIDYNGNPVLSAYKPFKFEQLNWVLLAEIDEVEAFAPIYSLYWVISLIALFSFVVVIIAALGITRSIIKPLGGEPAQMQTISKRIANGDLSQEFGSDTPKIGVYGAMAKMNTYLHQTISTISQATDRLASTAAQTSAASTQSNASLQEQHASIEHVANAIAQTNTSIEEVSESARAVADLSVKARETSHSADVNLQQTIVKMHSLDNTITNAELVIKRVEDNAQNINTVLEVIRSVAEQTNLLALNAAIEAARAGEHGRGFAVVADEVRQLAKKTQNSTADIEHMIELLQAGTQQAVTGMHKSIDETKSTITTANQSAKLLKNSVDQIDYIARRAEIIATAAHEQSSMSEEIAHSIDSIKQAAIDNAAGADQVSAASMELDQLSKQLQKITNGFRLR
ncbi:methyl-accepting chemotaxis protein [Pseudoalteromonas sp. SG45-5]|nr:MULTISPECIES: methyl-accepting chemotaxis protein [unclassified Pseudoalteromonas]MBB1385832.1 methyl-accepting chemotaxis protein [Pseudoalteromonas sp. SG45-5]MBB1393653.1 methyl-accepting chemotaxis protein [Pseudoalteromonas sp. SG44-4]MBB1448917.1 methyl-accepting chemotaxis protein [Pseudoalteromonas sp. SG41-6]